MEVIEGYKLQLEYGEIFDLVFADVDELYDGELFGEKLAWFLGWQLISLGTYYSSLKRLGEREITRGG